MKPSLDTSKHLVLLGRCLDLLDESITMTLMPREWLPSRLAERVEVCW